MGVLLRIESNFFVTIKSVMQVTSILKKFLLCGAGEGGSKTKLQMSGMC